MATAAILDEPIEGEKGIWAAVRAQKQLVPELWANFDFEADPERFTTDPAAKSSLSPRYAAKRAEILANTELVDRLRAYSRMGDVTADRYAALMAGRKFRELIDMLELACDKGIEAVPDAPPELAAFIADMEVKPDWLDMELVEEGARAERNNAANFAPYAVRGAFIATFMNEYAALPMALTGTLSNNAAARRVKETANFFAVTTLPGALDRFGPGFKAAAMVRLMHSMVRYNIARRPQMWDAAKYGFPIPQVDQMPAGLIGIFLMSYKLIEEGRTAFNDEERATVEFARYRCRLLGLPEELLPDTPQGIVDVMNVRGATLRAGFDDRTCGALVRATLAADLWQGEGLGRRIFRRVEASFSKMFFLRNFMNNDLAAAERVGVKITGVDRLLFAVALAHITVKMGSYRLASKIPGLADAADRRLIGNIRKLLADYGHAEFVTYDHRSHAG
ncbi:oxygenase MpaB family protein [Sandaracinobacteroides hominis]|uniref:oxygenase MpaB family protein n=1 Tax=Sandaracinobacteroides hominis TaxID=2780086 RepID=UPI0018F5D703|nr:oxygenase MpaB family protein [Sandaracinobacteroides hominis]